MKSTPSQRKRKLLRYVLYLAILFLGVAVGIAIRHYHDIPMIEAINIVDVATLIVTVFLAVYIPGVFDRQLQVEQEKQDLIEKRLEGLQDLYKRINQIIQQEIGTPNDVFILDNTLELAKNRLSIINTLLSYLDLDKTFEEELKEIDELDSSYRDLILGAIEKGHDQIYTDNVRNEEEQLFNRIDKATTILIFKINDI